MFSSEICDDNIVSLSLSASRVRRCKLIHTVPTRTMRLHPTGPLSRGRSAADSALNRLIMMSEFLSNVSITIPCSLRRGGALEVSSYYNNAGIILSYLEYAFVIGYPFIFHQKVAGWQQITKKIVDSYCQRFQFV